MRLPRLADAVEIGTVEEPARLLDTKCLIGFDLAAILSSAFHSCILFDIACEQLEELKMLMFNREREDDSIHHEWNSLWSGSLRVGFGVDIFDLGLGVQVNSVEQPVKSNSVGPGNMSHCRTSPFDNPLYYSLVVFKDVQHSSLVRIIRVWGNKIDIWQFVVFFRNWCLVLRTLAHPDVLLCYGFLRAVLFLYVWFDFECNTSITKSQRSSAREYRPFVNLQQEKKSQIPLNLCETDVSFSHIQLLRTNTYVTAKNRQTFHLKSISNLQDLQQSQSLETVPICIVVLCFPHENAACNHQWNECKRSNVLDVCHMLWSIFVIARASLLTDHRVSGLCFACQVQTLQNNLRAYIWQFSHGFQSFFFELMVILAWSWDFVEVAESFCVSQLATPFDAFICMTFRYREDHVKIFSFSDLGSFSVLQAGTLDSNMVL